MAQSQCFQAHLPIHFWSDCLLTTIYIINRIPTPLLKNRSPFELLLTKQPIYTHIKTFSCLAYVSTHQHTSHKFSFRSIPYIFLGYPIGIKRYKWFDPSTHKITISGHVIFHETMFPFQKSPPNTQSYDFLDSLTTVVLPTPFNSFTNNSPSFDSYVSPDQPLSPNPIITSPILPDIHQSEISTKILVST